MLLDRITLNNISHVFSQQKILRDIHYSFLRATSYAITGKSGSGKTTLLNIAASFLKPTSGKVEYYMNDTLLNVDHDYVRTKAFGFVFQYPHLLPELTILENVLLSFLIGGVKIDAALRQKAENVLSALGLQDHIQKYPYQLSGGQQQRASCARALVKDPAFLCADELTGNLDPETALLVLEKLMEYCSKKSIGLIISTHDQMVVHQLDKVLCIDTSLLLEKEPRVFKKDTL